MSAGQQTSEISERLYTERKKKLGKTKNEMDDYGQAGRLKGCNRLYSIRQEGRRGRIHCRKVQNDTHAGKENSIS